MYEPEAEEALKKWSSDRYAEFEAKGIYDVLKPQSGTDYSRVVRSPCLAEDPAGGDPFFLFTGSEEAYDARDLFQGRINENFEVHDVSKLLAKEDFDDWIWHHSPSLVYDGTNENWILVLIGEYSPTGDHRPALFRFSEDFSEEVDHQAPMQVDGADWWETDCVSLLNCGADKILAVDSGLSDRVRGVWTNDLTETLPTWSEQTYPIAQGNPAGRPQMASDPVPISPNTAVQLYSQRYGKDQRTLNPLFIHYDSDLEASDEMAATGGFGSDSLVGCLDPSNYIESLGSFLTPLPDGRKYNLFFFNRYFRIGPKRTRIRMTRMPHRMLDPAGQRAITFTPWRDESISAGDTTFPFPGTGERR